MNLKRYFIFVEQTQCINLKKNEKHGTSCNIMYIAVGETYRWMLFVKKQNHLVLTVLNWDYHLIWMFGRQIRNIIGISR